MNSLIIAGALASAVAVAPQNWAHSWDTALQSQFIDFGYTVLTDEQAAFVATHYQIASFEKCTGPGPTEPDVWSDAARIKAINPSFKAMFYWDVDQGALSCYNAHAEFMANPSWWLRDDHGHVVNGSTNQPVMDYTNAEGVLNACAIFGGMLPAAYGTSAHSLIPQHVLGG
jgi:hypothetical protein